MPQGNGKAPTAGCRLQGWQAQKTWAAPRPAHGPARQRPEVRGPGWVGEGRTQDWVSCQGGLQAVMGLQTPPVDLRVTLPWAQASYTSLGKRARGGVPTPSFGWACTVRGSARPACLHDASICVPTSLWLQPLWEITPGGVRTTDYGVVGSCGEKGGKM